MTEIEKDEIKKVFKNQAKTFIKTTNTEKCWNCGKLTNYYELGYKSHICSPMCLFEKDIDTRFILLGIKPAIN